MAVERRHICNPCPAQNAILYNNRKRLRSPRNFIIEEDKLSDEFIATINESATRGCPLCRLLHQHYIAEHLRVTSYVRSPVPVWPAAGNIGLLLARPMYWRGPTLPALGPDCSAQFEVLRKWISDCEQHHESCRRDELQKLQKSFTPKRVVEIQNAKFPSTDPHNSYSLRLLEETEIEQASSPTNPCHHNAVRYVTLSYMWGPNPHGATTTRENYDERRRAINFESLPKTFRDAIVITDKLGIRYLWIDALCIIQPTEDDRLDWELQSAKMADIYANSLLTISASSSTHAQEGCLHERPDRVFPLSPVAYKYDLEDFVMDQGHGTHTAEADDLDPELWWLNPKVPSFEKCVLEAPLNTRAWVLQERFFSRRVAYFTKRGLFWECARLMASDYEVDGLRDREDVDANRRQLSSRKIADVSDGHFWLDLVRRYSELDLTDKQDVLPAISGVVHWMVGQKADQYHAGLLGSKLLEGLCWATDEKILSRSGIHKRVQGVPTWSWASVDSPISHAPYLLSTWSASTPAWRTKVLGVDVVLSGVDPYGRVSSGKLSLSGVILPLDGRPHEMWRQTKNSAPNHFISCRGNDYLSIDDLDGYEYVFGNGDAHKTLSFLVMMSSIEVVKRPTSGPPQLLACEGILLKPTESSGEFKRVGWLRIYMDGVDLDRENIVEIVLV